MDPKALAALVRKLKIEEAKVAKCRDRIRDLLDEFTELSEGCDDAATDLAQARRLVEGAADRLSEMV